MLNLKPSHSAPTPISAGRSETATRSDLEHVFSAQHLDDVADYHGGDHDSRYQSQDSETEYADDLEQVRNQDYADASRKGKDEVPELRMGVADTRDLEANLEKKQTARSIKDPNLVRAIDCKCCKSNND